MMKQIRLGAIALIGALGVGLMATPPAHASKAGHRNTALILGAVAAYGLVKKQPVIAGVAGAGAVYSYIQSTKDNDRDRYYRRHGRYDRYDRYYRDRYRR